MRPAACATLALLMSLTLPAVAQVTEDTPLTRRPVAQELVKVMNELSGPERIKSMMQTSTLAALQQQLKAASHLTLTQRDRAAERLSSTLSDAMSAALNDAMPVVYANMEELYTDRFTLTELQELQRFYASSAGRKATTVMMDDMPRIMQPMMQAMQARNADIKLKLEETMRSLKEEGIDLKPPGQ